MLGQFAVRRALSEVYYQSIFVIVSRVGGPLSTNIKTQASTVGQSRCCFSPAYSLQSIFASIHSESAAIVKHSCVHSFTHHKQDEVLCRHCPCRSRRSAANGAERWDQSSRQPGMGRRTQSHYHWRFQLRTVFKW